MIDHVTMRTSDPAAAARFYGAVLPTIGVEPGHAPSPDTCAWRGFLVAAADADHPPTTGLHVGFVAPSIQAVGAFWQAGIDAGFTSDGAPGPRPAYGPDYYGAFLLDPDGNSIEAARHDGLREDGGAVDHLWLRTSDLAASRQFYDAAAAIVGYAVRAQEPGLVRYRGPDGGSFTLVEGTPPTRHAHIAFTAADAASARVVLDPDGHTVELVPRPR